MPAAYSRSEHQVSLSRLVPGVLTVLWTAGSQSGVWIAEISDGFHFGRMEWLNHVAGMEDYFCCRWIDENYLLIWSVCWFSYWLIPLPSTELCHSWKRILQIPSHFRSFLQTPWWFLSKAKNQTLKGLGIQSVAYRPAASVSLGACWKCRLSGPFYDPLSQNLHLTWSLGD